MSDVTRLLDAAATGDRRAAADLLPLVYTKLRARAAARMAAEAPDQTLQPTALVHEAHLRLIGPADDICWENRGHFFAAAAEAMRRAAFLDRTCGDDAGLRQRVEVLLRSHDPDGSFLGTPAAVVPDPDHAGTTVFSTPGAESPDPADDEVPLGFMAPSTRPDSVGRLGHYEILQVLGKGGFGIVFRAFDDVVRE